MEKLSRIRRHSWGEYTYTHTHSHFGLGIKTNSFAWLKSIGFSNVCRFIIVFRGTQRNERNFYSLKRIRRDSDIFHNKAHGLGFCWGHEADMPSAAGVPPLPLSGIPKRFEWNSVHGTRDEKFSLILIISAFQRCRFM